MGWNRSSTPTSVRQGDHFLKRNNFPATVTGTVAVCSAAMAKVDRCAGARRPTPGVPIPSIALILVERRGEATLADDAANFARPGLK